MHCYPPYRIWWCAYSASSSASCRAFWRREISCHSNIVEKCSTQLVSSITWNVHKLNGNIINSIECVVAFRSLDSDVRIYCACIQQRYNYGNLTAGHRCRYQQLHIFGLPGMPCVHWENQRESQLQFSTLSSIFHTHLDESHWYCTEFLRNFDGNHKW